MSICHTSPGGVGLDDNFFHLNRDSMHLLQVAARLESELDCDFDIDLLFEHPAARELATILARDTVAE